MPARIQTPYGPLVLRPNRASLADPRGRGPAHLNSYSYDGPKFSPFSAWNTPISARAQVDPMSDEFMRQTVDSDGHGRTLGFQILDRRGFTISFEDPLYSGFSTLFWYADETIPAVSVTQRYDYPNPAGTLTAPWPGSPVRIPNAATSATGSDGQMSVWDMSTRILWEMWRAQKVPPYVTDPTPIPPGTPAGWYAGDLHGWSDFLARPTDPASYYAESIDSGLGYRDYTRPGGTWTTRFGAVGFVAGPQVGAAGGEWHPAGNAYGGSQSGGHIMYAEMLRGDIPHALRYTVLTPMNHHYAQGLGVDGISENIACCCDGDITTSGSPYGAWLMSDTTHQVPMGSRIRIKASVDVAARARNAQNPRAATIIGACLQRYGAYLVDRGGQTSFQAETLSGKNVSWVGLLNKDDPRVFLPQDFEVMSLPPTLGTRAVVAPEWQTV